ncbi:MAG: hypothetical protein JNM14_12575 [Ferruginibacter sp.]|nr:hypothetical protein [Ferruginibacter sp.]
MRKLPSIHICLLIIAIATFIYSCRPGSGRAGVRHMSDSLFYQLNEYYHTIPEPDALYSLDSVFKTFPYISAIDQYRLYELKRNIYFDSHHNEPQHPDTALYYTNKMIGVLEQGNVQYQFQREYAEALQKKSDLLKEAKHYEEAVEVLAKCILINRQAGNLDMVCENITSSAYIAYNQKKYDVAIERFRQALELAKYHKTPGMRFFRTQRSMDDLGILFKAGGNTDSALYWHLQAEKYILKNANAVDSASAGNSLQNIYENISQIYLGKDSVTPAKHYISKAINLAERFVKDSGELYRLYQTKADVLYAEGNTDEADAMNKKARRQYASLSNGYKIRLLELQQKIDDVQKNYKNRAENLLRLYRLKDSINNDVIEVLKKDPQLVYEQLLKKNRIILLENKNKLQNLYLNGTIIIALLLVMMALIIFRNLKRSKQLNQSLVMREKQLKKLLDEIAQTKEDEKKQELFLQQLKLQDEFSILIKQQKKKISDDMHDELTSSLAALKYYLADVVTGLKDAGVKELIKDIAAEVDAIYTNARQYMHNLRNQAIRNDYDLPGFLKEISTRFNEKGLLNIHIRLNEEGINRLGHVQYDNLYFIIKEALSNVIKHSKAAKAVVSIDFETGTCFFEVSDDGKGADIQSVTPGLGLNSIRNRVKNLGGQIVISSPGGLTVKGSFPVKGKDGDELPEIAVDPDEI